MSDELLELALRIEAASGPDRILDGLITVAIDGDRRTILYNEPGPFPQKPVYGPIRDLALSGADLANYINAPVYTASLDAAMALVPENADWMLDNFDGPVEKRCTAETFAKSGVGRDGFGTCFAATPALALTAAALRARASHLRMEVE